MLPTWIANLPADRANWPSSSCAICWQCVRPIQTFDSIWKQLSTPPKHSTTSETFLAGKRELQLARQMSIEQIRECAARVRAALEGLRPEELPIGLQLFPRGTCGDACLILGAALQDQELGDFRYVCGLTHKDGGNESHAWLVGEGLIIDITADQFEDGMPAIFVGETSDWHDRWADVMETGSADYRLWTGLTLHELHQVYEAIKRQL